MSGPVRAAGLVAGVRLLGGTSIVRIATTPSASMADADSVEQGEGRDGVHEGEAGGGEGFFCMDDLQQVLAGAEAMPDDGTERAEPGAEVEYASRTAQRKTERRAGRVVRRAEQRLKSAAVKREERAVVRAARAANSSPSPEEQAGYYAIRNARRAREEARDGLREGMSLPWSHPGSRGVRVVIDLGMEALMNTSELKSLAAQVTISYGEVIQRSIHREGYAPLRLACTGLADAPKTKARSPPDPSVEKHSGGTSTTSS
ncbi:hypothetical protein T492DRAFT_1032633 [Pavlovales sp. CCMP2436]|nr:hypothetical protein T492DRAFT_1032633 [Pavlovales sp. CCMP2436]